MKALQFHKLQDNLTQIDRKLREQLTKRLHLEFLQHLLIFQEAVDRGQYHQVQEHGFCLLHVQNRLNMVTLTKYGLNDY